MYFPITIIDNFLNNFQDVKNYVLKQDFKDKELTIKTMPGIATAPIHQLNPGYFTMFNRKVLSNFYDRFILNNINYDCLSHFEKITPYGDSFDKEGWIHADDENILSCIFYIQGNKEHGTSFFKNKLIGTHNNSLLKVKEALYNGKNTENVFSPFYNEKLKEYNSQFELILNVPLVENRIVIFDSSILHRSEGYGEKDHPRIIQTCFFRKIFGQIHYPIPEINRIE
jgi:hypothetical protein